LVERINQGLHDAGFFGSKREDDIWHHLLLSLAIHRCL
jgi:hypothetical protein